MGSPAHDDGARPGAALRRPSPQTLRAPGPSAITPPATGPDDPRGVTGDPCARQARHHHVDRGADIAPAIARPMRVLVAEDTGLSIALIHGVLAMAPVRVDFVADGGAALSRLGHADYDAVMLDIRTPRLSGLDVPARFKAMGGGVDRPRPAFVACTGPAMLSQRRVYAAAGFDLQVAGPYRPADIADALAAVRERFGA